VNLPIKKFKTIKMYIGTTEFLSQQKENKNTLLNIDVNTLKHKKSRYMKERLLISMIKMRVYLFLEKHNYIVMHASALRLEDGVVIFAGPPNSGKSTILTLVGGNAIHDNEVIIKNVRGHFYAFSPPFVSIKRMVKYGYAEGPIKVIYVIKKARVNRIKPINKDVSFKKLFLNDYFYLFSGTTAPYLFLNYSKLIKKVSVRFLYFTKDKRIARCIDEDLKRIQ
jgi:serine kinase of HPr protein (carbohydrate metabolism regulator)